MTRPGVVWIAMCAAAAVLASGCGSTAQSDSLGPAAGGGAGALDGSSSELGATDSTALGQAEAPLAGSAATEAAGAAGRLGGSATGPRAAAPGETSATAPGAPAATGSGPVRSVAAAGMDAKTIKIGVYTLQAFSGVAASAGFDVATGDQEAQARAFIRYINDHGGMAGRKVVPVFHDYNIAAAANDVNTEYQGACAAWTDDERVYAVATPVGTHNENLTACLAKRGVISSATGDHKSEQHYQRYADYFYMPTEYALRRMLATNVDALHRQGFFGKSAKIGVIRIDSKDEADGVARGLRPALEARGLRIEEEVATPRSNESSSAYSSAVLSFKAKGITHVLFTPLGSPLVFGQAAESQGYRPRYGMTSRNAPASVLQGNMPAAQLRGSMGMGWLPTNDVDGAHDPGPVSKRAELCLKLLQEAGQNTSVRATAMVGLWLCDSLFFLRDVLSVARDFSPAGFRQAAEGMPRYEAASTFVSRLRPGRPHDGAQAYRVFAFQENCSCFAYITPLRTS